MWGSFVIYWEQPIHKIAAYFGPKIAFYFAWLGHYSTFLWGPALLGLGIAIFQKVVDQQDHSILFFYVFIMSLWSSLLMKFWKRTENELRFRWGLSEFEDVEVNRPSFIGTPRTNPISNLRELHYPRWKRAFKYMITTSIIFCMMCLVVVLMVIMFVIKDSVAKNDPVWQQVANITYSLVLVGFNSAFVKFALVMNNWENHKTESDYDDMLIGKVFVFQFINSYLSLFYVSFFKNNFLLFGMKEKCNPSCFEELHQAQRAYMMSKVVTNNLKNVVVPWIQLRKNALMAEWNAMEETRVAAADGLSEAERKKMNQSRKETEAAAKREVTRIEAKMKMESLMLPYDRDANFEDFNDLVLQYGFMMLFGVSFTLSPLLALIDNLLAIRSSAFKLCRTLQRPMYTVSGSIGTWFSILQVVSLFSVLSGFAILAFTMKGMDPWFANKEEKYWFIVCIEHFVMILRLILSMGISDTSDLIRLQMQRLNYIVHRPNGRELFCIRPRDFFADQQKQDKAQAGVEAEEQVDLDVEEAIIKSEEKLHVPATAVIPHKTRAEKLAKLNKTGGSSSTTPATA
eukprot:gnl/Spiro4/8716_TR4562_c0_g1_i1.p1 gnl/Spiro4/8716_TR4562_c0_g1~~gnl/Spiro4/8716_TR4562_c0_g1_i1.p1  ORF type:complete len:612 (+),score=156.43 gnl/Spiro4/8716_TR4562_c0_g1_i1:128-1837(+)